MNEELTRAIQHQSQLTLQAVNYLLEKQYDELREVLVDLRVLKEHVDRLRLNQAPSFDEIYND